MKLNIFLLAAALVLGAALVCMNCNDWRVAYDRIELGMSMEEVNTLLGPPTEPVFAKTAALANPRPEDWFVKYRYSPAASATWKIGDRSITVHFETGKAIWKGHDGGE